MEVDLHPLLPYFDEDAGEDTDKDNCTMISGYLFILLLLSCYVQ
jgi:hypothetical protein